MWIRGSWFRGAYCTVESNEGGPTLANSWEIAYQTRIDFENESKWQWLRLWRNLEWLPVLVVCVMGESMQLVGYGP